MTAACDRQVPSGDHGDDGLRVAHLLGGQRDAEQSLRRCRRRRSRPGRWRCEAPAPPMTSSTAAAASSGASGGSQQRAG